MTTFPVKFDFYLDIGPHLNLIYLTDVVEGLAEMLCLDSVDQLGFKYSEVSDGLTASVKITSDDDGDVKHVMAFVLKCASRFQLEDLVGFTWSPARPARGASGNGACVIDLGKREIVDIIDLQDWVSEKVRDRRNFKSHVGGGIRRLLGVVLGRVVPSSEASFT